MYNVEEKFAEDGQDLKEILKSCIYNYYLKNKDRKIVSNDLPKLDSHCIMSTSNKEILSTGKEIINVQ